MEEKKELRLFVAKVQVKFDFPIHLEVLAFSEKDAIERIKKGLGLDLEQGFLTSIHAKVDN